MAHASQTLPAHRRFQRATARRPRPTNTKTQTRSAAAAHVALGTVASVLPLLEKLLVAHHRTVWMPLPAMSDVGVVIGNPAHQATGLANRLADALEPPPQRVARGERLHCWDGV